MLVTRAKKQTRDTAKRVIINHSGSAREKFDKEIIHILLQYEEVKNDNFAKTKRVIHLEDKLKKLELTLAHSANFFRKCETVTDTKNALEEELGPDPLPVAPWRRRGGVVSSEKFIFDAFSNTLEFNDMMI